MRPYFRKKIVPVEKISEVLKKVRTGKTVVFTNGCFDILHYGHVKYLGEASAAGDILVVGLNTDESVKKIKDPCRPLTNQSMRSMVLASLGFIDYIVLFKEKTPLKLIKKVKPDILVKGADYTIDNIVGADYVLETGGMVKTIPLVKNISTSLLVKKILKLYSE